MRPRANCIPCSKRKVRCDRTQPCCHCRRRPGDICEYPAPSSPGKSTANSALIDRINSLERYIRDSGGDPARLDEQAGPSDHERIEERANAGLNPEANRGCSGGARVPERTMNDSMLVEHQDEVTYIETPMWYSWSGSTPQEGDRGNDQNSTARSPSGTRTILEQALDARDLDLSSQAQVPSEHLKGLWSAFLKNVHPLVKIFYDWEIEALIRKADVSWTAVSTGEKALVFAIMFSGALSLSSEDCLSLLGHAKAHVLDGFQRVTESGLFLAGYSTTTNIRTLQALMLYMVVMNTRSRPAAVFSLAGVIVRIAERMGLQRDGEALGLNVLRAEERRRMWWQLQMQDIGIARNVGTISLSLFANWDTKLPSNIEDGDLTPETRVLPPPRKRLTSMSSCLCLYEILSLQRNNALGHGGVGGLPWILSPSVSLSEKDALVDQIQERLGTKFLQYCELLNPLHVWIQLSSSQFFLAARRTARQPALVNAKISEMSRSQRDELLDICVKSLEYWILLQTTDALRGFIWSSANMFSMTAFVYVILETHHRFNESDQSALNALWELIQRIYTSHPERLTLTLQQEFFVVARITLAAWQRRATYLRQQHSTLPSSPAAAQQNTSGKPGEGAQSVREAPSQHPTWIKDMCQTFGIAHQRAQAADPSTSSTDLTDVSSNQTPFDETDMSLPELAFDFDFDTLDWAGWEDLNNTYQQSHFSQS